jgi:hypothetical protein
MNTYICFFAAFSIYLEHIMLYGNGQHCKYVLCNIVACDNADLPLIDRVKKYLNNLQKNCLKILNSKQLHQMDKRDLVAFSPEICLLV